MRVNELILQVICDSDSQYGELDVVSTLCLQCRCTRFLYLARLCRKSQTQMIDEEHLQLIQRFQQHLPTV